MTILEFQAKFPDYYEFGTKDKNNLNFKHSRYPMSITATEFLAIQSIVKRYEPKRGFEVATGTGVSAIAAALSMKSYGGRLVTMDCYVEESAGGCDNYAGRTDVISLAESRGAQIIDEVFESLKLPILQRPGRSPNDVADTLCGAFGFDTTEESLEYVFIDAMHTTEAVIADTQAILPYLAKRFVLLYHDVHCFGEEFLQFCRRNFGTCPRIVENCGHPGPGFNLAIIDKMGG